MDMLDILRLRPGLVPLGEVGGKTVEGVIALPGMEYFGQNKSMGGIAQVLFFTDGSVAIPAVDLATVHFAEVDGSELVAIGIISPEQLAQYDAGIQLQEDRRARSEQLVARRRALQQQLAHTPRLKSNQIRTLQLEYESVEAEMIELGYRFDGNVTQVPPGMAI